MALSGTEGARSIQPGAHSRTQLRTPQPCNFTGSARAGGAVGHRHNRHDSPKASHPPQHTPGLESSLETARRHSGSVGHVAYLSQWFGSDSKAPSGPIYKEVQADRA